MNALQAKPKSYKSSFNFNDLFFVIFSVDSALQRWRRQVNRSGHLMVLRNRRYFENNQEKAIRKEAMARKRRSIMRSKMRSSGMLDGSSSPVQALKVDKFTRAVMAGRDTTLLGN